MLVLNRRRDQAVRISDDIIVTVLRIQDGEVRLGITAPPEVDVHRGEVYDRIQRDREWDQAQARKGGPIGG